MSAFVKNMIGGSFFAFSLVHICTDDMQDAKQQSNGFSVPDKTDCLRPVIWASACLRTVCIYKAFTKYLKSFQQALNSFSVAFRALFGSLSGGGGRSADCYLKQACF